MTDTRLVDFTSDDCRMYIVDANRGVLARFAKNYLPLLFNIYTGDAESPKDPKKLAVYETIKCYMQIAKQEVGITVKIFLFCSQARSCDCVTVV